MLNFLYSFTNPKFKIPPTLSSTFYVSTPNFFVPSMAIMASALDRLQHPSLSSTFFNKIELCLDQDSLLSPYIETLNEYVLAEY